MPDAPKFTDSFHGHDVAGAVDLDAGSGFKAAVGYGIGSGFRAEIEYGYRKLTVNGLTDLSIIGPAANLRIPRIPVDGHIESTSLMANGYYAFDIGAFRPYVGAGLGSVRHGLVHGDLTFLPNVPPVSWETEKRVRAYQVMAGVGRQLTDAVEARFGYRYFTSEKPNFDGAPMNYDTHNVEFGLVLKLGLL